MAENRFPCGGGTSRETVCIETNRVLDSCRDRDCYENVRVYLSDFGNEILERTGAIRAKSAEILWTNIGIDPIQFNRGFYAVTIRFYIRVTCEACVGGGRSQEVEGIAVLEKRVILYGGLYFYLFFCLHYFGFLFILQCLQKLKTATSIPLITRP